MEKGKVVVFIGVAALHVAAVAMLRYATRQPTHRVAQHYAVWIVDDPKPQQISPPQISAGKRPIRRMQSLPVRRNDVSVNAEPASTSTAPVSLPDWYESSADVVNATVMRQAEEQRQRNLYPAPNSEMPFAQSPAPLFKTPLYDHGTSHQLGEGELNTWIGPECYASNRPQGVLSSSPNQLNVVCKGNAGKRKANGDLFDHLRPDTCEKRHRHRPQRHSFVIVVTVCCRYT